MGPNLEEKTTLRRITTVITRVKTIGTQLPLRPPQKLPPDSQKTGTEQNKENRAGKAFFEGRRPNRMLRVIV